MEFFGKEIHLEIKERKNRMEDQLVVPSHIVLRIKNKCLNPVI